jgi:phosphatidylethanolamine/phosphatidyl-N-methylethanolamine N-methyltransferase
MAEAYGATGAAGAAAKSLGIGARGSSTLGPKKPLDSHDVRNAYQRWAGFYDFGFGLISKHARSEAVAAVNRASGETVLEVGVGTGLALPLYAQDKRVTGIDLCAPMLELARERVAENRIRNIEALLEMDAQATSFADGQFDIAVAMFVASVVPDPQALVAELKRVVKPGGTILFVNHFAVERGPIWWVERAMAPFSSLLGWHPDFRLGHMFPPADIAGITVKPMRPWGLFGLIELKC